MGTARANDLRAFHDFADAKLSNGGRPLTLKEALDLWRYENYSPEEREEEGRILRAATDIQARVDKLAEKSNEGELNEEERAEYAAYIEAFDVLAVLQAKARSVPAE